PHLTSLPSCSPVRHRALPSFPTRRSSDLLTEQQPLAGILGTELELRLINYRETTPLRAGQVDDEPYGGGAGMDLTRAERRRLPRSEEHTSELQSRSDLVCRLLLEKKKK